MTTGLTPQAAKDEVFMSFWHMSSFIYLKRNHDQSGACMANGSEAPPLDH
jgi:hypothetical protein